MHDLMEPIFHGPSLIWKMSKCCPGLNVAQISRQQKMSSSWLPSDWFVTIRQSLRLMNCVIVLDLHGHLYLYMPFIFCLTQCLGVEVLLLLQEMVVL
ncbi:hypothetical protein TNCV_2886021 [Trichonephila clavipes]|nr:hypothetical protein TNCV_2886021 [Trichonephila clavipes]